MADDDVVLPWLTGQKPPVDETTASPASPNMSPWAGQQPAAVWQPPPPPPPPGYEKLARGAFADPVLGGAQLATHLGVGGVPSNISTPEFAAPEAGEPSYVPASTIRGQLNKLETDYQGRRTAALPVWPEPGSSRDGAGTDWWRVAGNVVSPANYATGLAGAGAKLGERVASGGLQGVISSLLAPVEEGGNYWTQKARDLLFGGATGVVGGSVGGAVRGSPTADQQLLQGAGVRLSPGAGGGKLAGAVEDVIPKLPVIGRPIAQSGRNQMIDSFNLAVHNDVLEGIGGQLPKGTAPGQPAFDHTMGAFNKAYEDVLPQVTFRPGQVFQDGLAKVGRDYLQLLPEAKQTQFMTLLQQQVLDPLQRNGGKLGGEEMKLAETDLRKFASRFAGQGGDDGIMADAVNGVRRAMRQQLRADHPDLAPQLSAIDRGYARLATVKDAGLAATTQGGVFTPAQLLQSIRNNTNPNDVLRGGAPLQDLADAAQRVIGSARTAGRSPATAGDMFISELLASRLGAGAALGAGAGAGYAATQEGVPDWLKYGAVGLLALPGARRAGNAVFSPGQVARTVASRAPYGAALATPSGLLGQTY